ncbi:MAG: two-component sensor histidine kinase [Actinomycetia bacterium]|nr:two-component sensor histidine kinase [Actinomycetes bacterium]
MKRRIFGSILGVTFVAVLLLGVPLALSVDHLYASQEVLRLEREASESRGAVNAGTITGGDPIEFPHDGTTAFAAYNPSGRRIAGSGPARADAAVARALRGDVADTRSGGRIVIAVPVTSNERVVAAVRASRPVSVVTDRTHRAWLVIALIAAGALGVAALLARRQAQRLTRPVDALVDSAERLGAGEFGIHVERSGIGELDRLGRSLEDTALRLGEAANRERAFSSDVSHQLRTPIAGLRVRVESALRSGDSDLRAALEETLVPIDQLESTVEDLLSLARDTHADRSPLDVPAMLHGTEATWHGRLAAVGRPLRVEMEADLASPRVAEPAARQVLEVLMDNALQHGGGAVTLRARNAPGAVIIDVVDEGPVRLDAARIFERRVGRSNGIGLALARTLAEAEGGRLLLDVPGPGPAFSLLLPVRSVAGARAPARPAP